MSARVVTLLDRCVEQLALADPADCFNWFGYIDADGYGACRWPGGGVNKAHRVVWTAVMGPVAPGLELDHLCKNRACVNPAHLEPITHAENVRRSTNQYVDRTHCPYGHPYSGENLFVSGGKRRCRICAKRYSAERRARNDARRVAA